MGVGVGLGVGLGLGLGLELVQPPGDCLRNAKGAPDGDPRDGRPVSWKPNAEGLAGRAEATPVCSGRRGPGQPPDPAPLPTPHPHPREGLGLELVQPPGDCLRHAKGAPDGDPRDGPLVSWKPNAEGLAGRAEAPQVCSGSRCPGHPPPGGVGVREPKSWDVGAGAKGEGRQRAYSTRYSQAVSHPSKNQARPCLASEIRRDRARSGCYGLRRRPLPPGALRALRCASLSL